MQLIILALEQVTQPSQAWKTRVNPEKCSSPLEPLANGLPLPSLRKHCASISFEKHGPHMSPLTIHPSRENVTHPSQRWKTWSTRPSYSQHSILKSG